MDEPDDAPSDAPAPEVLSPLPDPAWVVLGMGGCGAVWVLGRWLAAGGDLAADDVDGPLPFLSFEPPIPRDTEGARWAMVGDGLQLLALVVFAGAWLRARGRRAAGVVLLALVVGARAVVGLVEAFGVGAR